ncbi:hypothetical protein BB559_005723 [Furculomyces boomerangus]|uniref:ATP synthase subunit epsilon, mitochondrial n=2 Tax=Harpellales TaxID=61421 RepID=A0A2T9Y6Z2_9FUNG|nr:hypothetical protein BB559_005723 [Furculomyces boomerangus]PVZ97345.1 hypothetical protein BB558_006705 [Smittium angustum]
MSFAWRNAGINYLQYCNIAGRALRRVLKEEHLANAAKRDKMEVKYVKWSAGKHTETVEIPTIVTRHASEST